MGFDSKNMNYIFHVEYFDGMDLIERRNRTVSEEKKSYNDFIREKNDSLYNFHFEPYSLFEELLSLEEYREFSLYTSYPGLLLGIGNPHQIAEPEAVKLGFSFDFVTGLPYIPGSSLKGMLRSMFPEEDKKKSADLEEMIRELLGKDDRFDVKKLMNNIFEGEDVFLGAYPEIQKGERNLLSGEYITSHQRKFKNPIPISFLKVKPDIAFKFCFLLKDYKYENDFVSAQEKSDLFRELILLGGIGAKTNVGFGRFLEKQAGKNVEIKAPQKQNYRK